MRSGTVLFFLTLAMGAAAQAQGAGSIDIPDVFRWPWHSPTPVWTRDIPNTATSIPGNPTQAPSQVSTPRFTATPFPLTSTPSPAASRTPRPTSTPLSATPTPEAQATRRRTFTATRTPRLPSPSPTVTASRTPKVAPSPSPSPKITYTPTATPAARIPGLKTTPLVLVYPNPYRADVHPRPRMVFAKLPEGAVISLYDMSGHLVRTEQIGPSQTQWEWNLENHAGTGVASGVYLYVIQSPGRTQRGKVALLR